MKKEKPLKSAQTLLKNIRKDFPQLKETVNGYPLIYLDSAATTLKPKCVIETLQNFYLHEVSNVHRGAHSFSDRATEKFEESRGKVKNFIGARGEDEIIFTKGTTEAINLVAYSYVRHFLQPKDEIVLTEMEHHSNIVPWQMVAEEKDLKIRVVPVNEKGELDFEGFLSLLNKKTRFVSMCWISNVLGTVNPVKNYIKASHEAGARFFLDAAQSMSLLETNVQDIDCDFLTFSGHKIFAPFGIGVLYGKKELLSTMPPYQTGGATIQNVSFEKTHFLPPPQAFEAGTPPVAEAMALGVALDYVSSLGVKQIYEHEKHLMCQMEEQLKDFPDFCFIGQSATRLSLFSFTLKGCHCSDVGSLLNQKGVAVRTGHHCAEPLMKRYQLTSGTVRVSFSIYNNEEDIQVFIRSLFKARELLKQPS